MRAAGRACCHGRHSGLAERIDGANPTWQLVWTKPTVNGEVSQSGLGDHQVGRLLIVFPKVRVNWGVVQRDPADRLSATWQYTIQSLQDRARDRVHGQLRHRRLQQHAERAANFSAYGRPGSASRSPRILLGRRPIYAPSGSNEYWLAAECYYLVKQGVHTLYEMAQQAYPTAPFASWFRMARPTLAGGFDFENFTEAAEYGWGAWTQHKATR